MLLPQPRWEFVNLKLEDVLKKYRDLLNTCLPRSLAPNLDFYAEHVPYIYPTVKYKCFGGSRMTGSIKTCDRPGHSCFRNVVSFVALPGRQIFKSVGRALRTVFEVCWSSWCFKDQARSGAELSKRYNKTKNRPANEVHCCAKCKKPMAAPGGITADAGQAYEAVRRPFVSGCLDALFKTASTPKFAAKTISVLKTVKYYGFVGGRIHQPAEDRVVFWLDRIRHCVDRLLAMDIYRFGDGFVQQETGIPIGGPISGVVLDIVCSVLEYLFDKLWETLAKACNLKGQRSDYIATGRYADDAAMLSKWFCSSCLRSFLLGAYSSELKFETTTDSHAYERINTLLLMDFNLVFL